VDADQPLKWLFRTWTPAVVGLFRNDGPRVVSARVVELPATKRSVDLVIRLRRGQETYLRHVEFEMRYRRGLELRLFEYTARLEAQFRLPVATTVVFVRPPAPKGLSHRDLIGGRIVNEWRFDVLRLWDLDPEELLAMGPAPAALVGSARGSSAQHVRAAVELISRRTAPPERDDLLYVLQALCGERYTGREIDGMIPQEAVMGSGMVAKVVREARAQARAQGRAEVAEVLRSTCLDVVKHHHPAALERVAPVIETCQDLPSLHKWTLEATRMPASEFVRLVTAVPRRTPASSQRRAPRPARRAASRRR
jgi:hypothetical protein